MVASDVASDVPARTGWVLLARDATTFVVGERLHPVGIGQVLTVERREGTWALTSLGSARVTTRDPAERVEHLVEARVEGSGGVAGRLVDLTWDCEADLAGLGGRVVHRWRCCPHRRWCTCCWSRQ